MLQIKPENRLTIEQIKASRVLGGEFDMSLLSKVMKKWLILFYYLFLLLMD